MARVMSASGFVRLVENHLGWQPVNAFARTATVKRVADKVAEDPELYTWRNLSLAVELLRREQKERSPLGVFVHVQRALDAAPEAEDDIEGLIREAVQIEQHRGDPDGWVVRFARATGWWRVEAYKEWRSEQAKPR